MTRQTESEIRNIIRQHLSEAQDDIANAELVNCWWPDGFAERLAEQVTQSIALMAEASEMAEEE